MKWLEKIQVWSEAARSCWAVDIGTTAVRAVALKRSGKKIRLLRVGEVEIPRESPVSPPPEAVEAALRKLVGECMPAGEIVVSSLPLLKVFLRSQDLPFTKLVQIQQVIASEAELHIPFPLDQVVIDFWPTEELEGNKTRVMMAAVKKDLLRAHLELLDGFGLDPARVGVDFLGLANAFQLSGVIDPREVTTLIEVGATHTGVAFFFRGRIRFMRSFPWGGDTMSGAIMKELGCGFGQAEAWKKSSESERSKGEVIREALVSSFNQLESELMRTLHSASAETFGEAPQRLILAGGAANHRGLREFLVKLVGCPVGEVDPWRAITAGKKGLLPSSSAWGCLGLALGSLKPSRKRLNFRRQEFSFRGSWEMIRRRLWMTLGFFLALAAVWAVALNLRVIMEKKRYENKEEQIQALLNTTFPEVGKVNPGDEIYEMENALKQMRENYGYYRGFASLSVLDILREISRIIPPEIKVQVVELDINQERIRFKGRTDSYSSVDRVKNSFQKSNYFQADKIREGDTKTKMVGGKLVTVEFNYMIPLAAAVE